MIKSSAIPEVQTAKLTESSSIFAKPENPESRMIGFIKLLTTQLQNQDPTSPMEIGELSQVIGNLVSVQEGVETNQLLTKLLKSNENYTQDRKGLSNNMVSYIGRTVGVNTGVSRMQESGCLFKFFVPQNAAKVSASILDDDGTVIMRKEFGPTKAGDKEYTMQPNEGKMGARYKIALQATGYDGKNIEISTITKGIVKMIDTSDKNCMHLVLDDGMAIEPEQILSVF